MMRNLINTLICLLALATSCSAQSRLDKSYLKGVWQVSSQQIGSAYQDNYQFFEDGTFVFNTNQYNELRRIISLKGLFQIDGDSISLEILSIIEDTGSIEISRSRTTTVSDSWSLAGEYAETERVLEKKEVFVVDLKICECANDTNCILLDGKSYYKILDDPDDY